VPEDDRLSCAAMAALRRSPIVLLAASLCAGAASQQDVPPAPPVLADPPFWLAMEGAPMQGSATAVRWPEGGGADLSADGAAITFGPSPRLAVTSETAFAIDVEVRATRQSGFATLWMCREREAVHHSLVVGRESGRVSFEVWSWAHERATSRTRIDDGEVHRIRAAFDPAMRVLVLEVDGVIESIAPVRRSFEGSPAPGLRLGNNLNEAVHQPFSGVISRAGFARAVPDSIAAHLTAYRRVRVLEPGEAESQVRAWNDALRPHRAPDWQAADHPAAARRVQALVQDALGLWPPPFSGRRLAGRPSPVVGGGGGPTDFAAFSPSLPLDVRTGGVLDRDGYRVVRTYWQAFPGHEASGWLYEPVGPERRFGVRGPAILCPHGHWQDGARHPTVQARLITLAKLGYLVLAVDSIHVEDTRVALSSVAAMTWSNLRALELLRRRDDVDPTRIGCTGASGGGQQTYYLTALDCGLAAAAPAVMVCHLAEILDADHVHCRCNHTPHLARVVDVPEMSASFAPRPQFFLSVTGDWTHAFPREGYPEIEALYRSLGAGPAVAGQQWDRDHDYDRPMRNAAYAFFERWLGGVEEPGLAAEPEGLPVEPVDALRALDRDDARQDPVAIAREFRARLAVDVVGDESDPGTVRERLSALFGSGVPEVEVRLEDVDAAGMRRGRIRTSGQPDIPLLALRGRGTGAAVCISDRGMMSMWFERAPLVSALRERFETVWLADIRYVGELDVGAGFRGLHGRFFGQDEGQVGVLDVRRLAAAAPGDARAAVVALGQCGAVALLAAGVDARIGAVVAPELGPTWREADRRPQLSRILLHGDLPEAVLAAEHTFLCLGGSPAHPSWDAVDRACAGRLSRTAAAISDDELVSLIASLPR
jgi:dienelactone hydrolase